MMMYYQRVTKKKTSKIGGVLLALLILIFILNVFSLRFPQSTIMYFIRPILDVQNVIFSPLSGTIGFFKDKQSLEQENQELLRRVAELELKVLQQSLVREEQEMIVNEIGQSPEGVQVRVLVRPPFSPYDTLLLDVGDDVVSVNDSVFLSGVLIGTVERVYAKSAIVRLLSSPSQKTVIRVAGLDAEAEGLGSGRYTILVPKDSEVNVGDVVVAPSAQNALFGVISEIRNTDGGSFKTLYFTTPVALSGMTIVTVVKNTLMVE